MPHVAFACHVRSELLASLSACVLGLSLVLMPGYIRTAHGNGYILTTSTATN